MFLQSNFTPFVVLLLINLFQHTTSKQLCDRLYFNHGDETKIPYVQLEGIYRKYADGGGHPIFKHEQRNYHFQYLNSNGENFMVFSFFHSSKTKPVYIGLRAHMANEFMSPNWIEKITDEVYPFQTFIIRWQYYDWQSKTHISVGAAAVSLTCVPQDVFRCSSEKIFFNTTFTSTPDGTILHNYLSDYFEEMTDGYDDYKNYRKKFRHSRQTNWIMYYESPYWKVKNDRYSFYKPFLRAKDSSFRPEYITAAWQHLDGSTWKSFTNPVGIRCRGFLQENVNGTVKLCSDSDPCLNGGICVNSNLTNETICRCNEPYTGPVCRLAQKRCSKYLYDSTSVQDVMIYGLESSNFASIFCKEDYRPQYFLSQCITARYSSNWSPQKRCYYSPSTKHPPTNPHSRSDWGKHKEPFNFDDYPAARPVILTVICLLQLSLPCIHMIIAMYKDKSGLRAISMHAFISYVCWWVYFLGCRVGECQNHGRVLVDLIIMSVIMIPLCYIFMLIESCCSPEKEYIRSILADVSVVDFVEELKRTDPQRIMMIECYHWETRTRTVHYTDANGNTQSRIETYQERVTTYTEQRVFPIGYAEDISNPEGPKFDLYGVTRLKLTSDVECGDEETVSKFLEMRQQMIDENEYRDTYVDFTYSDVIDGFKKRICAYTDPKYRKFWMNAGCFWIASLLGLTWVFRIVFNWKTKKCEYTIKKLIYFNPRLSTNEATRTNNELNVMHDTNNAAFKAGCGAINNIGTTADSTSGMHLPNQVPIEMPTLMTSPGIPNEPPPAYDDIVQTNR